MIYVFYNNDPLAQDLGGGAEHFRGLHRALLKSGLDFRLVSAKLQGHRTAPHVEYISETSNFLRFYLNLWLWFWRHRNAFGEHDVFHFHRNYAAWPKLVLAPRIGRVMISYHNVTGKVIEGWLGRFARPIRRLMLILERRVAQLSDAIVCVSNRDRMALKDIVSPRPFEDAKVIPAAFDGSLFQDTGARPPGPTLAHKLIVLGRLSHQKNIPLAIEVVEALTKQGFDYRLTIAGDGEDARSVMKRIATSPAKDRIDWVGRISHDDVPKALSEHGILLLSSRYEASPTVVKEALRTMRPVVATDVGDVPDWIDEDQTGFVCDNTPQSLADGVVQATRLILEGRYAPTSKLDALSEDAIMVEVMQLYRRLQAS